MAWISASIVFAQFSTSPISWHLNLLRDSCNESCPFLTFKAVLKLSTSASHWPVCFANWAAFVCNFFASLSNFRWLEYAKATLRERRNVCVTVQWELSMKSLYFAFIWSTMAIVSWFAAAKASVLRFSAILSLMIWSRNGMFFLLTLGLFPQLLLSLMLFDHRGQHFCDSSGTIPDIVSDKHQLDVNHNNKDSWIESITGSAVVQMIKSQKRR